MEIPYTVDERPDTGIYNAKLGIWLFLASEVMLFGGLFSAYVFLRLGAPVGAFHEWGQELNVPLATLNTLILISSSMTMVMSWVSLKMNDFKKFKLYMALTLLCALCFLVIKYFIYISIFMPLRVNYAQSVHGKNEINKILEVIRSSTQMGKNTREFEEKIS